MTALYWRLRQVPRRRPTVKSAFGMFLMVFVKRLDILHYSWLHSVPPFSFTLGVNAQKIPASGKTPPLHFIAVLQGLSV